MQASQLPLFFQHLETELTQAPNEIRRLFHGRGRRFEGLEQITCDWLQGQLIINLFREVDDEFLAELKNGLKTLAESSVWSDKQGRTMVLQHRYADGAPSEVLLGELDARPVVEESGLKYQLDIGRNQNFGLFLDMRYGRDWVRENAKHKNVLNLFAYTCGFSVAAIAGGADKVVNVDMAKASLSKGRENHKLNGHNINQVSFLGHDIFKSWGKIKKSGQYDLIIIDPNLPFETSTLQLLGLFTTHPEVEFHALLVTFLSSLVLRFSASCYGCHQLATGPGVSQQVSSIYPSKPALCSHWGCLPHREVEFHAMPVTF